MTHPVLLVLAVALIVFGVFLAIVDRRVSNVVSRQVRAALRILIVANLLLAATLAIVVFSP